MLGCSAGGLQALHELLAGLSGPLPVPLVMVCHSGSEDMALFCQLLENRSGLPVREAEERVAPVAGVIHVAPSGYHLLIERDGRFALNVDPRVAFSRPSIDVLFESASGVWGEDLVAVLLTGANADGANGCARVRHNGGIVVIQDPSTAHSPEMPGAALALSGADYCVDLMEIPELLERLCK